MVVVINHRYGHVILMSKFKPHPYQGHELSGICQTEAHEMLKYLFVLFSPVKVEIPSAELTMQFKYKPFATRSNY